MKNKYISDYQKGEIVQDIFYVREKSVVPYKNKPGFFLSLLLSDKTGNIKAKLWDIDSVSSEIAAKSFIICRGEIVEFAGTLEINLQRFDSIDPGDVDSGDFLPTTPYEIEQMQKEIGEIADSLSDPHLSQLLSKFCQDEELFPQFCKAPAAKMMHQAYIGGLLEHSLNTAKIVCSIADLYPTVNKELAVTGALLHDIGKVHEYNCDYSIEVSDEGRLLGHIVLGLQMLDSLIQKVPGFPEKLQLSLQHILTSHHGRYEWQSPRRPKTIEACLVHYADMMEADMWKFSDLQEKYRGEVWSPWDKGLERFVYLG